MKVKPEHYARGYSVTVSELIDRLWPLRGDLPVTFDTPAGDCPQVVNISVRLADEGEAAYIEVE